MSIIIEMAGSIGRIGGGVGAHEIVTLNPTLSQIADSKKISTELALSTNSHLGLKDAFVFRDSNGQWCAIKAKISSTLPTQGIGQEEHAMHGLVDAMKSAGSTGQQISETLNAIVRDRCLKTYKTICQKVPKGNRPPNLMEDIARLQVKGNRELPQNDAQNFNRLIKDALPSLTSEPILSNVEGTNLKLMFMYAPMHGNGLGSSTKAFAEPNISQTDFGSRISKTYAEARKLIGSQDTVVPCEIGTGIYAGGANYASEARSEAQTHRGQLTNIANAGGNIAGYIKSNISVPNAVLTTTQQPAITTTQAPRIPNSVNIVKTSGTIQGIAGYDTNQKLGELASGLASAVGQSIGSPQFHSVENNTSLVAITVRQVVKIYQIILKRLVLSVKGIKVR